MNHKKLQKACDEARRRVSKMTPEQRHKLWKRGIAIINKGALQTKRRKGCSVRRVVIPAVLKPKDYRFMVVVKRAYTRRQAELALLTCFSLRAPDYCEFNLRRMPKQV
jgi:hypothetical protein